MTKEKSLLEYIHSHENLDIKEDIKIKITCKRNISISIQIRKKVVNRLARIEGHVRSIKNMVENERDCSDVLIQIAAVRKALDNAAKVILKDHLEHCILHAIEQGDSTKSLENFESAIDQYLR